MAEYVVLDTDVASHAQRQQLPADYARQLDASVPCITFVTVAEFYKGACKRNWGPARIQRIPSPPADAALCFGQHIADGWLPRGTHADTQQP